MSPTRATLEHRSLTSVAPEGPARIPRKRGMCRTMAACREFLEEGVARGLGKPIRRLSLCLSRGDSGLTRVPVKDGGR